MRTKVVHYIATLKDGGAQTQLIHLCNGLDVNIFDVYIICWNKETSIPCNKNINIIEIQRGSKFYTLKFMLNVFLLTIRIKPDIIHLWLPEIITVPAALAGLIRNIPVISTERRIPVTNFGKLWIRDRIKYINHFISRILIANFPLPITRKSVLNVIAKIKGKVIYNGVDIESLVKFRTFIKQDSNEFVVAYTGRFVPQKNVDLIILALKDLIDQGYKIRLLLFGTGELKNELEALVSKLELNDDVKFYGYIDNWKSVAVSADVFVLPSDREGMPNVLFEAAAIGLPIITSSIEEISCHFNDNYDALLLERNDLESLKSAIKKLIENPDLRDKLRDNSYKTIEKYSIETMVSNYDKVYRKLLELN